MARKQTIERYMSILDGVYKATHNRHIRLLGYKTCTTYGVDANAVSNMVKLGILKLNDDGSHAWGDMGKPDSGMASMLISYGQNHVAESQMKAASRKAKGKSLVEPVKQKKEVEPKVKRKYTKRQIPVVPEKPNSIKKVSILWGLIKFERMN